jgi:hypothetical protein
MSTMSFDPHSRRFDPRMMLPAIERNASETSDAPDASPFSWDDDSTNDLTERDFDEALEQVTSERRRVCALCGRSGPAKDL